MAKETELGEAVTGIAWLELMSTDEENLNDTVIFKQSYEGKIQNCISIKLLVRISIESENFRLVLINRSAKIESFKKSISRKMILKLINLVL